MQVAVPCPGWMILGSGLSLPHRMGPVGWETTTGAQVRRSRSRREQWKTNDPIN